MSDLKKLEEKITEKITQYVWKKYKWLTNKKLIIREKKNCFHILAHEDASPLILGKGIINN